MSPFVLPFVPNALTKEIVSNTFIMFSNISRQKRIPPSYYSTQNNFGQLPVQNTGSLRSKKRQTFVCRCSNSWVVQLTHLKATNRQLDAKWCAFFGLDVQVDTILRVRRSSVRYLNFLHSESNFFHNFSSFDTKHPFIKTIFMFIAVIHPQKCNFYVVFSVFVLLERDHWKMTKQPNYRCFGFVLSERYPLRNPGDSRLYSPKKYGWTQADMITKHETRFFPDAFTPNLHETTVWRILFWWSFSFANVCHRRLLGPERRATYLRTLWVDSWRSSWKSLQFLNWPWSLVNAFKRLRLSATIRDTCFRKNFESQIAF